MRGQNEIIRMRMSGYKPTMVWVLVLETECQTRYFADAEKSAEISGMPEVHIGVRARIAALDFRFLHGVTVLLQGTDDSRIKQAYRRMKMFSPDRIIMSSPTMLHDTRELK